MKYEPKKYHIAVGNGYSPNPNGCQRLKIVDIPGFDTKEEAKVEMIFLVNENPLNSYWIVELIAKGKAEIKPLVEDFERKTIDEK